LQQFKKMKKLIVSIAVVIAFANCNNHTTTKKERQGEPAIYSVTDQDSEMNEAIKTAKETLNNFNDALKSGNTNFTDFCLKVRFKAPNGWEHIWLSDIKSKDNTYMGVVSDLPDSTTEVNLGDTIQIINEHITDWMYRDNKKLRGGYTIRLLRKRMTETERKQFDTNNNLIIEE
jgi:uncharacterized protein YegJ (DUF2314 family)